MIENHLSLAIVKCVYLLLIELNYTLIIKIVVNNKLFLFVYLYCCNKWTIVYVLNCIKLCEAIQKLCQNVLQCVKLCATVPNNKPNLIFNDWKLFVPNYAKMSWCVQKCAKLCTTVSVIKLYLFSTAENDLCQTVRKCATLFKTEPICDKSV